VNSIVSEVEVMVIGRAQATRKASGRLQSPEQSQSHIGGVLTWSLLMELRRTGGVSAKIRIAKGRIGKEYAWGFCGGGRSWLRHP